MTPRRTPSRRLGALLLGAALLAGCSSDSGSGAQQAPPGSSSGTGGATGSGSSGTPVPGSASPSADDAFAALAKDAPPAPVPDAETMYSVAQAETPVDFSTCGKATVKSGACKKPASLGARDLKAHVNVEILLDASGSMKEQVSGKRKIDIARTSIADFVASLPTSSRVSVRTFGNGADEPKTVSCASSRLVVPFQAPDASKVTDALGRTVVQGYTPLAGALTKAQDDFEARPAATNSNYVYVVSDGEETCDGDPVAAAKALTNAKIGVQVNVIGFSVDSKAATQLKAAAEAGDGVYADATDDKALGAAFTKVADWKAWTSYYNCRYGQVALDLVHNQTLTNETTLCLNNVSVTEFKQVQVVAANLRDELKAQLDARTSYLQRAVTPQNDPDGTLGSRVQQESSTVSQALQDAYAGVLEKAKVHWEGELADIQAKRVEGLAAAQKSHDDDVAQLQQQRDKLGLEPGH